MADMNAIRLDSIRRVVHEMLGPNPTPAERREMAEILDILAERQRYHAAAAEREGPQAAQ